MTGDATHDLSQAEVFAFAKSAFEAMAHEPVVELLSSSRTDDGDLVLELKVKRWSSVLAAPYRMFLNPEGNVRAFADIGVARLDRVTGPNDTQLSLLDAVGVIQRCRNELASIVPDLHSLFPRYAFYSPGTGRWEILTGTITNPDTGLNQFELRADLSGSIDSLKRVAKAW